MFESLENEQDFHLLLLDINMPVKDGRQCLKILKSDERFKHIPVVMYTVSASETDIHEAYEGGAHYFVVKPYAQINFTRTIQTVFDINWKETPAIPPKEHFVINFTYSK